MHIQVINFGINVSHEDFVVGATELAPNFASIPGLISKHWLGDEENKVYGGVYVWESKEPVSYTHLTLPTINWV